MLRFLGKTVAYSTAAVGAAAAGSYALGKGDTGSPSWRKATTRSAPFYETLPSEAFIALYSASRTPFIHALSAAGGNASPSDSGKRLSAMGLTFRNDLGNSAGLGQDGSLLQFDYALGAGYTVVGTVLEPHTGNVFQFLGGLWSGNAWTPLQHSGAALNSLGLPSKGVDAAVANIAAFRKKHGIEAQKATTKAASSTNTPCFPIGVSIMGHPNHSSDETKKLDGVVYCVKKALPQADFIEINESCPNVHHGSEGGGGSGDKELAKRLTAVVAARAMRRSRRRDGVCPSSSKWVI